MRAASQISGMRLMGVEVSRAGVPMGYLCPEEAMESPIR
jgi:hypothetical protein